MNEKGYYLIEITVVLAIIGVLFILTPLQMTKLRINSEYQDLLVDIGMMEGALQNERLHNSIDITLLPEYSHEYLRVNLKEGRVYSTKGMVRDLKWDRTYHCVVSVPSLKKYKTEFVGEWLADGGGNLYYISHKKNSQFE